MICPKALPPAKRLRELIVYDWVTGAMFWQPAAGRPSGSGARRKIGERADRPHGNGYLRVFVDGDYYPAHRVAWAIVKGVDPKGEIDHIDRNRTNNAIANLRCVSRSENAMNVTPFGKYARGVSRDQRRKKNPFRAVVSINGKPTSLGSFPDEESAAAAVRAARSVR